MNRNKLITATIGVLTIILIIIVLLTTSFRPNTSGNSNLTPTPISSFNRQRFDTTGTTNLSGLINNRASQNLTGEDRQKLQAFTQQLPYSSRDFVIAYSSALGRYYVQKKSANADQRLQEFLKRHGVDQIFRDNPGLLETADEDPLMEAKKDEVRQTLSQEFVALFRYTNSLPADQKTAFREFIQKLPYQSDSFDIAYSPYLNQFFVNAKAPDAEAKLNTFLTENNVLAVKNGNQSLFVVVRNKSVDTTINEKETQAASDPHEFELVTQKESSTENQAGGDVNLETFKNFLSLLTAFDPGPTPTPVPPPAPGSPVKTNKPPTSASVENLLNGPNLILTSWARADLEQGLVDQRLVNLLAWLLERHIIRAGYFISEHGGCPRSNHCYGRAVDIGLVDSESVNDWSNAARVVSDEIRSIEGELRPTELGQPFYDGVEGIMDMFTADHHDHIHIGYDY